jgi:hypothetical protein
MTPTEIKKTIAEFCGWLHAYGNHWTNPGGYLQAGGPPDYCASFDALREAEGKLSPAQQFELKQKLWVMFHGDDEPEMYLSGDWRNSDSFIQWLLFTCTPLQRATALAETIQQAKL